ncbi:large ribosomal subunit protein mL48 [Paroedura picta]|uniref:large ribosomal subunit protein mL48 n=1 Tax=Paroedura picta TaxID=143630 RepID=UPI004057110A
MAEMHGGEGRKGKQGRLSPYCLLCHACQPRCQLKLLFASQEGTQKGQPMVLGAGNPSRLTGEKRGEIKNEAELFVKESRGKGDTFSRRTDTPRGTRVQEDPFAPVFLRLRRRGYRQEGCRRRRRGSMSSALRRVFCLGREPFPNGMLARRLISLAFETSRRNPASCVGNPLLNCVRQYRSHPAHGIGRYRHLLPEQVFKKKRDRVQMKEIDPGTEHTYGFLNIVMTSYDMGVAEHYARYVVRLCNRMSIKIEESYAMPTKTTEVMMMQEKGSKMYQDAVLTSHQRVVQISGLTTTFAPILLEIIQSHQPEGLHLLVKEHTEDDFKVRLKGRPELEQLLSQMR